MAIRLALLGHHYRGDWEWTPAELTAATFRLDRWRSAVKLPAGPPAAQVAEDVRRHLANDLDAPSAAGAIDRWADEALAGERAEAAAPAQIRAVADALLGIDL